MFSEHWGTGGELLSLFGIDPQLRGAADMVALIEIGGELLQFPDLKVGVYAVAVELMRLQQLSPLVFWSRIKRQCAALMEAEADTLAALGLHLEPDAKRTAYAVANAAAEARAAMGGGDREWAMKYAAAIKQGRRKKQQGRG